ncbi:MAG: S49 family peptidase [Gammaproteobacteria bacterium]|nr:S49 family peptidase [Gammaproteobacteria bacterium]
MADNDNENGAGGENWERELLNRLSFASLAEQRRTRRWGIFFKLLTFAYLAYLLVILATAFQGREVSDKVGKSGGHTAVVEVNGMISDASRANADNIIKGLRDAYANRNTKGIVLRINSPGGSPVQSDYVYREIMRLKGKHPEIPLHAVIVDVGASGAYYIASAADNIYVNPSSVVGSIGVLMNGFGFVDAMDKLGVERRLLTAGENKGMLDPFLPLKDEDVAHIQGVLGAIHQEFVEAVKAGRGERLAENPQLFSGMFWSGAESIELGLADEVGDVGYVAREVIKVDNVVDFTHKPDFLERFADRMGASMANVVSEKMGLNPGIIR